MKRTLITAFTLGLVLSFSALASAQTVDPLPSWNDGTAKQSIVEFVEKVTRTAYPDFVLPAERIAAFGNSDGDLQMLQWTTAGQGPGFALYLHHTDGEREWAYDRNASMGRLNRGLYEARAKEWTVVDMQQDWKVIYPHEKRSQQGELANPANGRLQRMAFRRR